MNLSLRYQTFFKHHWIFIASFEGWSDIFNVQFWFNDMMVSCKTKYWKTTEHIYVSRQISYVTKSTSLLSHWSREYCISLYHLTCIHMSHITWPSELCHINMKALPTECLSPPKKLNPFVTFVTWILQQPGEHYSLVEVHHLFCWDKP